MDRIFRIDVTTQANQGQRGFLLSDIAALGIAGVQRVERADIYFLRGDLGEAEVALLCEELLADPITQQAHWALASEPVPTPQDAIRVDVGLLQGVTDTVASNLMDRAQLLEMEGLHAASTAQSYLLYGHLSPAQVHTIAQRLLCNEVIQYYHIGQLEPHVGVEPPAVTPRAEVVPIRDLGAGELLEMSKARLLSLDLAEMQAIQRYFAGENRDPTDVELESLAQTWSEHCVHKTFKGVIEYTEETGDGATHERIDGLIKTYLRAATEEIHAPWVRSAFVDNAGIVDFTDEHEVSFKVETHNHPSALEPFGGANTGVGGVVRDIMGVSARPIASTDVLCFGPLEARLEEIPAGVLHPRRIYNGVVHGVEDYGNKMGIPTVNGGIYFDPGYTANPLVYCGCVGLAPVGSHPREAHSGDLVVVLGGRTGRDGLHGATFSSIELTEETGETSGGAVQIGNPITEKMVLDAILVARDEKLYHAITDCGAGGLSSAVSEMGEKTGVAVQLAEVPLKYHGLQPWEIWLSEAQERMILGVPRENESRLREICDGFSVEMTVIGTFTGDGRLVLHYGDQRVADISMEFLHGGIPRRTLAARWSRPAHTEPGPADRPDLEGILLRILAHPNVRSKEDVVRRYDHEVQAATVIKPFVGAKQDGPSDGAVLKPLESSGTRGIALGCGFNPAYGAIDPYSMAVSAIDEAVRNVVCVGADPERVAILDNFCWGNPLLPDRMGSLVRACKGCYDEALRYGTPFISGKDSLNNEYADTTTGQQVAIPPSLLISALGIVPDIRRSCTMDLKEPGHRLYLVGLTRDELGGSYYYRMLDHVGSEPPGPAEQGPEIARALHEAIRQGYVAACHDCSEGGLAVALAEMCIAGRLGAEITLNQVPKDLAELASDRLLFSESNGRYLLAVPTAQAKNLEELLAGLSHADIGHVTEEAKLVIRPEPGADPMVALAVTALTRAWRGHLAEASEEGAA